MSRKPRSLKQTQAHLAVQLRDQGRSWAEIATEFRLRFHVNARVALRQARGWTQPEAAARWNRRWPEEPKTFKNFSYWEAWPSSTGHAPSLDVLHRLAQLYECSIADLVADFDDYGGPRAPSLTHVTAWEEPVPEDPLLDLPSATVLFSSPDLGSVRSLVPDLVPTPLPIPASVSTPGELPSGLVSFGFGRVDDQVVAHGAQVVEGLRRQSGALGPGMTLQTAMAVRGMMEWMVKDAPVSLAPEAWSVYGDLTQLIGWLMFNLGDDASAHFYYEDARAAAYRAQNLDLASFTLASLSHLAMARGHWQAAIDHGQAAHETAKGQNGQHAIAYAADISARAYAAAGQLARCHAALDRELAALSKITPGEPAPSWWYFFDRSFYWGTESECALRLGMSVEAVEAAGRSLKLVDPVNLHNSALTQTYLAEALIRQGDITQACHVLGDAARLTALNSSLRISRQVARVRSELRPWDSVAAVRDLDVRLDKYRRMAGGFVDVTGIRGSEG